VSEFISCVAPMLVDITFLRGQLVQDLQDKSYTNEEKLKVMQRITEEFSIPFNTNVLEREIYGVLHKHVKF